MCKLTLLSVPPRLNEKLPLNAERPWFDACPGGVLHPTTKLSRRTVSTADR
jgi:hypothetical protein